MHSTYALFNSISAFSPTFPLGLQNEWLDNRMFSVVALNVHVTLNAAPSNFQITLGHIFLMDHYTLTISVLAS